MAEVYTGITVHFGGEQPAEVHFDLGTHRPGEPEVGIRAVKTAAGDILGALAAPELDRIKKLVLEKVHAEPD